jgi:uncharacterized repeat protein (TIGR02543 family)
MEKLSTKPPVRGLFALFVLICALAGAPALFGQDENGQQDQYLNVTFDIKGWSKQNPIEVKKGEKIDPIPDPTRDNDKFAGWFKDEKLTQKWNFDRDVVNDNITLYAKWQVFHKVEFLSGDNSVKTEDCEDGKPVDKYQASKDGYFDFVGWYATADFAGDEWNFKDPITGDKTFYAKWSPRPEQKILDAIDDLKSSTLTEEKFDAANTKADKYLFRLLISSGAIAFLILLFGILLLLLAAKNKGIKKELAKVASKDDLKTVHEGISSISSRVSKISDSPPARIASFTPPQDTSAFTREIDRLKSDNTQLEDENRR